MTVSWSSACRRRSHQGRHHHPGSGQEKPIQGEVIAVGTGKLLDNGQARSLDVKVGDRVMFGKYAGSEIKIDGTEQLILRRTDPRCHRKLSGALPPCSTPLHRSLSGGSKLWVRRKSCLTRPLVRVSWLSQYAR